jgi:hypothetical protein
MSQITRLDDLEALKDMGVPLNPPIEYREFSPQAEDQIDAGLSATRLFGEAVETWAENQNEQTYAAATQTWSKLDTALKAMPPPPRLTEHSADNTGKAVKEAVEVSGFTRRCTMVCQQWDSIWALSNEERAHTQQFPWPLSGWPA